MGVLVPQASSGGKPLAEAAFYSSLISTPTAPTVTPVGATGTTTWSYEITAVGNFGGQTAPSPAGSTTTGVATLSTTDYNLVSWAAPPLPAGAAGNLVYDSNLTYVTQAVGATWANNISDGYDFTFGSGPGELNVTNPGTDSAALVWTGNGTISTNHMLASQVIAVTPGASYTLSAAIDNPVGSGVPIPTVLLIDPGNTVTYFNIGLQPEGTNSVLSTTWTAPSGVTEVVVVPTCYGTVANGVSITWSQIQFTETATVQPYEPGPLWSYYVYRDGTSGYELVTIRSVLAVEDTGLPSLGVPPPTTSTLAEVATGTDGTWNPLAFTETYVTPTSSSILVEIEAALSAGVGLSILVNSGATPSAAPFVAGAAGQYSMTFVVDGLTPFVGIQLSVAATVAGSTAGTILVQPDETDISLLTAGQSPLYLRVLPN
ncbi:MAG: hypothetical protein M0Z95_11915 [Actinomycetota bacterium]|nr:hypothetical protein [Actinomycetota bacterium]